MPTARPSTGGEVMITSVRWSARLTSVRDLSGWAVGALTVVPGRQGWRIGRKEGTMLGMSDAASRLFTVTDLEAMPDDGRRYELIDG